MNSNNANNADIAFNSRGDENKEFEDEVKVKFMKYKSNNVVFLNEEKTLPQFTSFPERHNVDNTSKYSEGFPKLKQRLFNGLSDSTKYYFFPELRCENNNVNSSLFTNKK